MAGTNNKMTANVTKRVYLDCILESPKTNNTLHNNTKRETGLRDELVGVFALIN